MTEFSGLYVKVRKLENALKTISANRIRVKNKIKKIKTVIKGDKKEK
jgi:hypothetical protein